MNLIQEFYKNLDVLELIIFWGIILVIILTIILAIILLNKKKKTNKTEDNNFYEELPIKIDDFSETVPLEDITNEKEETIFSTQEESILLEEIEPIIETPEKNIEIEVQQKVEPETNKYITTFERPSAPYQKNVLREMSLSQTSPIGINRKDDYVKPQDLFEMYNKSKDNTNPVNELERKIETFEKTENNETLEKLELTDYQNNTIENNQEVKYEDTFEDGDIETTIEPQTEETVVEELEEYNSDIERTQYEIEQEENAIISYKELMEKKDSIQTIDEEDAIISIEELMNKTNNNQEKKEESKLYNISEEEENDSFINELKQFRKDL